MHSKNNRPEQIYENQRHVQAVIQNNFYMDDFIQPAKISEESIEAFNQLQSPFPQHVFELKKLINSNDAVTEAIPENEKSTSNPKQTEMELNIEGL